MASPTKERLLRFTILAYRREDITEEEFHHHWTHNHAPLVREWLARHGILRYTQASLLAPFMLIPFQLLTNLQYHTPSSIRQQAISIFGLPEFAVATYDGFVELLIRDLEDFKRAQQDPFYIEKVAPDEAKMADPAKTQVIVGWEECYVLDGKVLADGEAGVVRG